MNSEKSQTTVELPELETLPQKTNLEKETQLGTVIRKINELFETFDEIKEGYFVALCGSNDTEVAAKEVFFVVHKADKEKLIKLNNIVKEILEG